MSPAMPKPRARRVLVVSYHFPPDGSVGGLRWGGLTKYLARRGWEVHVVTAAEQKLLPSEPGLHIHRCVSGYSLNDAYNAVAARLRSLIRRGRHGQAASLPSAAPPSTGDKTKSPYASSSTGIVGWLRTNLSALMAFPDWGQGWIFPAASMARRLMSEREFDVVVSSGPPHSAHLAATLACFDDPRKLVVDMRDPWAALIHESWAHPVYNSAATRGLVRGLERLIFRRARAVVANTAEFAKQLRDTYPGLRAEHISNGIDPERLPVPETRYPGLSIAYAGTLYLGRDLSPVVRAIRRFIDAHPNVEPPIKLRVAGNMDATLETRFRSEITGAGLDDLVEIHGPLPNAEAMRIMNRSHVGLVLAQGQPTQIPAKIYECVGMGLHTLVIAESTSAAAREAERVGAIALESTDIDGIARVFERAWSDGDARTKPLAPITYDAIAAQMAQLFESDAESQRR